MTAHGAWSPEQVLGLAPDDSAAKAGSGLATPRPWSGLGRDDGALWGLCKGSGSKPYQTQVDLSEPAFKCSCPSRKFPCKHALGLMLLWSADPDGVPQAERPDWVDSWLADRAERTERARRRAEKAAEPRPQSADPEAQARRAVQREERVRAGAEELRRWLADIVRRGLVDVQRESYRFWDEVAARMVDAQAGGLGSRVRRMAGAATSGDGWPERLLEQAALTYLALEGLSRLDELPPGTQADVRALVGWTVPREKVLAGARERDRWAVVGQVTTEDDRLRSQRTWLRGTATGREALVLSFASPGRPFDVTLPLGAAIDAELAFYPGAAPLRALVVERFGEPRPLDALAGHRSVDAALAARAERLAADPWVDRVPVALDDVMPVPDGGAWLVADRDGAALRLRAGADRGWPLLALSGGAPIGVFGELEGDRLTPLSAFADGRLVLL